MEKTFLYILFIFIGFLFSTCEDKLEVPPPNSLTDEMIQDILRSGDENKINLVLGSMAEGLDHNFKLNDSYSGFPDNPLNPLTNQDLWCNLRGNDIVLGEPTLGTSGIAYQIFYNMDPGFEPWRADDRSYNYTWWKLAATPHTNANKVLDYLDEETVEQSGSKLLKVIDHAQ